MLKGFLFLIFLGLLSLESLAMSTDAIKNEIKNCVPSGYKDVVFYLVKKESSFREFAINVNGVRLKHYPKNKEEARDLLGILAGTRHSYDVGLGQINNSHFKKNGFFGKKGYTIYDALNPCLNLKMAASIIDEAYGRTGSLVKSLSIYNTGSPYKGVKNGYVGSILSYLR